MQADQAFEGAFRRTSDGALAAEHLTKLFDMRNMSHAGAPHYGVYPALDQGEQILQRFHGLLLFRRIGECHLGDVHRVCHGIRVDGLRIADLLLHGVQIDAGATGILAQQRLEAWHQPRYGSIQARMGELLQCKIAHRLSHVDLQGFGVFDDVLYNQAASRILQQRNTLVETAAHFMRQIAGGASQLHGERRVADETHQLCRILHIIRNRNLHRTGENAGNFCMKLRISKALRQNRSQRVTHRLGYGRRELCPGIDAAFHPSSAGEHLRLALCWIELAGGIEPQIRLADGTAGHFSVFRAHAGFGSLAIGLLQCQ